MIDIVKNIFHEAGFESKEADSFIVFSFKEKTSYWIVKELETLDFLKEQDELFFNAKKIAENNSDFDKNASLLLLNKVEEDITIQQLKNQILDIEEDPYQFKKQVLIYTESAKEELDTQLMLYSLEELLSNQKIFKDYKDNYPKISWQTLLYRTAQKLPFIKIKVEENKNLASLFQSNQAIITNKGLDDINNRVTDSFSEFSASDIKELSPENVLDLLLTEEEKSNGTENK